MINIVEKITFDIKKSLKDKDTKRLRTLRFISAALKQHEVDTRESVSNDKALDILEKISKQHKDSIQQFEKANRLDLVDIEKSQLSILTEYMPQQLSSDEIKAIIDVEIKSQGASSIKDMGKVMAGLKGKIKGQADFSYVSKIIKDILSQ